MEREEFLNALEQAAEAVRMFPDGLSAVSLNERYVNGKNIPEVHIFEHDKPDLFNEFADKCGEEVVHDLWDDGTVEIAFVHNGVRYKELLDAEGEEE